MSKFYEIEPNLENYWRSIILFGRNVASYKFALAKALYDLKDSGDSVISLEQLAVPFSRHTEKRQQFLQDAYNCSITHYGFNQKWQPPQQGIAIF